MHSEIVLTLTGPDRVGVVEEVTSAVLGLGGNVTTSRMVRLGGEFAALMLVTVPQDRLSEVDSAFAQLTGEGYRIVSTATKPAEPRAGWVAYAVTVAGADHEGIVHGIAATMADAGINIESVETDVVEAPVTGSPLFTMNATVLVPPQLAEAEWTASLLDAGARSGVDVTVALA